MFSGQILLGKCAFTSQGAQLPLLTVSSGVPWLRLRAAWAGVIQFALASARPLYNLDVQIGCHCDESSRILAVAVNVGESRVPLQEVADVTDEPTIWGLHATTAVAALVATISIGVVVIFTCLRWTQSDGVWRGHKTRGAKKVKPMRADFPILTRKVDSDAHEVFDGTSVTALTGVIAEQQLKPSLERDAVPFNQEPRPALDLVAARDDGSGVAAVDIESRTASLSKAERDVMSRGIAVSHVGDGLPPLLAAVRTSSRLSDRVRKNAPVERPEPGIIDSS